MHELLVPGTLYMLGTAAVRFGLRIRCRRALSILLLPRYVALVRSHLPSRKGPKLSSPMEVYGMVQHDASRISMC
eukprot:scaffold574_cov333-Pavlova_lutheri.AAC.31